MKFIREKTELDLLAEKYIDQKNLIKKLEEELDIMKVQLVSALNGKEELSTDYHKITNKEQIRDGINLQKLKENFPEAYNMCFKPSIFTKLLVK